MADQDSGPAAVVPDLAAIHNPHPEAFTVTWLGHATFLLQTGGLNFLTDPIFSPYCSPIPLRRFRRHAPPGIALRDLPRIDAVLLSHNHYDHLDRPTLSALGQGVDIYCPLGLETLLRKWGFASVTELSWGESVLAGSVCISSLPTQHGSGRSLFDRNQTLWCGWMVGHGGRSAIFLGDTGYSPVFKDLGAYLGPVELALIPIGAYRPEWFMRPLHLNPTEAVKVHRDLRAKTSIAMHWGTFSLADEPLGEPPRLLPRALSDENISPGSFHIPSINETIVI